MAAASRPQPPSYRRRRNRCHFSPRCFAAEHSLARIAAHPALATGHQPWLVDRRFSIAASDLPPTTQPLPLLTAVLRSRALPGSHRRPSCMAVLAASHQKQRSVGRRFPVAASELPPLQPLPLLAAVLRSRALLGSRRRPSGMAALAASHQPLPLDRRFRIAASELPPSPQPPPLLSVVLRS